VRGLGRKGTHDSADGGDEKERRKGFGERLIRVYILF
jgi:hypothetical protein